MQLVKIILEIFFLLSFTRVPDFGQKQFLFVTIMKNKRNSAFCVVKKNKENKNWLKTQNKYGQRGRVVRYSTQIPIQKNFDSEKPIGRAYP